MSQLRALRVFVAGLIHETSDFSPIPTSKRHFDVLRFPGAAGEGHSTVGVAAYDEAISVCAAFGHELIEGPCFRAEPAAPVSAVGYQLLRDEILTALSTALPLDVVLLALHGAMTAEGNPDCDGDILSAVRAAVGTSVPIGVICDLHGNISQRMVESGAIIVGVKEYPHVDYRERVEELHAILVDVAAGARVTTHVRTIPVLSQQGTTEEPMRSLVEELKASEGHDGIRSITLMHGFPWSDQEETGASLIVIEKDAELKHVHALMDHLAQRFVSIANSMAVRRLHVAEAVDQALAVPAGLGPVVIADCSDNPGGGAACDSTFLIRELLKRQCRDAAVGMLWDPHAAELAADAGVGARLQMRIGGKIGATSGDPVDVEVEVLSVRPDATQRTFSDEALSPLGLTVGLRTRGIDIVINSVRQQVLSPECFTALGIDVKDKAIVVVKSSQHFRARFDPIARATVYSHAPGSLSLDLEGLPYRRLRPARQGNIFVSNRPVTQFCCPNY